MTDETEIVPQAYPLFVPLRRDGTEPTWDDLDKWDATLKGKTRVQLLEMMDTDVSVHRVVAWRISKANSGRIPPPSRITTDGSVTRAAWPRRGSKASHHMPFGISSCASTWPD